MKLIDRTRHRFNFMLTKPNTQWIYGYKVITIYKSYRYCIQLSNITQQNYMFQVDYLQFIKVSQRPTEIGSQIGHQSISRTTFRSRSFNMQMGAVRSRISYTIKLRYITITANQRGPCES